MAWATAWGWIVDTAGYLGLLTVATASWWLPALKNIASAWLENQFAKRLKEADQAFAKQLKETEQKHDVLVRHLQSSIDREFDRSVRLHTSEFNSLAKGWRILHNAYWRAREATNRGYQIHDFAQMGTAQTAAFIDKLDFPEWRKTELRALDTSAEKQAYYLPAWRWNQYRDCQTAYMKLVRFIDRRGIFMQPEVKAKFLAIDRMISDALLEFQIRIKDLNAPVNRFDDYIQADALKTGEAQYKELENMIHNRLWSSSLAANERAT